MEDMLESSLLDHLQATTGLPRSICARIALDVLASHAETLEDFVLRRHAELKAATGFKNERIYELIAAEIPCRRFAVESLSTRQIRRLIYG